MWDIVERDPDESRMKAWCRVMSKDGSEWPSDDNGLCAGLEMIRPRDGDERKRFELIEVLMELQ